MTCNCEQLQQSILESDLENLSREILDKVEACPSCSTFLQQAVKVHQMVGLKRYESANVFVEKRYLRQLDAGLDEIDERGPASRAMHQVIEWSTMPSVRYAAAAALCLLVGSQAVLLNNLPGLSSAGIVPTEEQDMLAGPVLPSIESIIQIASNDHPHIEYGPADGAVPVRFDR